MDPSWMTHTTSLGPGSRACTRPGGLGGLNLKERRLGVHRARRLLVLLLLRTEDGHVGNRADGSNEGGSGGQGRTKSWKMGFGVFCSGGGCKVRERSPCIHVASQQKRDSGVQSIQEPHEFNGRAPCSLRSSDPRSPCVHNHRQELRLHLSNSTEKPSHPKNSKTVTPKGLRTAADLPQTPCGFGTLWRRPTVNRGARASMQATSSSGRNSMPSLRIRDPLRTRGRPVDGLLAASRRQRWATPWLEGLK